MPTEPVRPGDLHPYGKLPVPRLTPDLLALIRTGAVYSLSVVYAPGIPAPGPLAPFNLMASIRHGDEPGLAPASYAAEVISMSAHVGTHIDALCHIGEWRDEAGAPATSGRIHLYCGDGEPVYADRSVGRSGQTHLSIVDMPPIVTRAVLLDIAGYKGVDVLPPDYVITPEDINGALARQGSEVRPGTAVLLRTGFYRHLAAGDTEAYKDHIAGPGVAAAQHLLDLGMTLAGADNMTVEAFYPPYDHAVHRLLLVKNGVTHLENLYLEALAAEQIYEFVLIVTPLRIQGATGSWVHPIALV